MLTYADVCRPGLAAFKAAMQAYRQQQQQELLSKYQPFSFQKHVDARVNHLKKLTALQFAHVPALRNSEDPPHTLPDSRHKKTATNKHKNSKDAALQAPKPLEQPLKAQTKAPAAVDCGGGGGRGGGGRAGGGAVDNDRPKTPKKGLKFEVLSPEDYAEQDFLEWRQVRVCGCGCGCV